MAELVLNAFAIRLLVNLNFQSFSKPIYSKKKFSYNSYKDRVISLLCHIFHTFYSPQGAHSSRAYFSITYTISRFISSSLEPILSVRHLLERVKALFLYASRNTIPCPPFGYSHLILSNLQPILQLPHS